jgi:hypothetical protein
VSLVGRVAPWLFGVAVALAGAPAQAQSNLDAGKTPAQIFSDTCGACHRSPRELRQTSAGFLREHYSTGGREAAAMAAYLASIGSDPRAVQQRRPPTLGAGQAAPAEAALRPSQTTPPGAEPAKPSPGQSARPRRPSDSIEVGRLPAAGEPGAAPSHTAAVPAVRPYPEEFEE